ncbi:MAG: hypothetical protein U0350_09470 [Caldilineaceae bacterium]
MLIQAELTKLQGNLVQGRAILESQDWTTESESSVRACLLQGEFLTRWATPTAPPKLWRRRGHGGAAVGQGGAVAPLA